MAPAARAAEAAAGNCQTAGSGGSGLVLLRRPQSGLVRLITFDQCHANIDCSTPGRALVKRGTVTSWAKAAYDSTSINPATSDIKGFRLRCSPAAVGHRMVGFADAQPTTTTRYSSIDFGFYCDNTAGLKVTENWALSPTPTVVSGDAYENTVVEVRLYPNGQIQYWANSVHFLTSTKSWSGRTLWMMADFHATGACNQPSTMCAYIQDMQYLTTHDQSGW